MRQWADWGFDYCKYDWALDHTALARENVAAAQRLVDALNGCGRDMVLELSNSIPLQQAAEYAALGQVNRTTGDLIDLWDRSQMGPERSWAVGIREVWLENDAYAPPTTQTWVRSCSSAASFANAAGEALNPAAAPKRILVASRRVSCMVCVSSVLANRQEDSTRVPHQRVFRNRPQPISIGFASMPVNFPNFAFGVDWTRGLPSQTIDRVRSVDALRADELSPTP
mgnify:CR=1 FL=1